MISHSGIKLSLFPKLKTGTFIRRLNRFAMECSIDGKVTTAHLPNPGRPWELLFPNAITARGRKHIAELTELFRKGVHC